MSRRRVLTPPRERPPGRARRPQGPRTAQGNVREAAAWVLERTLETMAPAEAYLDGVRSRCDERDHGLLFALVQGTLRWMRRLDHAIEQASHRELRRIETPLLAPLRLAAYQLFFLERMPSHAIVHEAVEHAHHLTHRGGASFTNAVLRRLARSRSLDDWPVEVEDPVRRLAIELSHPDFLVERWLDRFGEERTRAILEVNNRAKPWHLLAFSDRGGRELLAESLIDEGLEVEPSSLAPLGLKARSGNPLETAAFARGELYVQDEVAQAVALLPAPSVGEEILDVAAAPGGKVFALLAREPSLRCFAADASLERLGQLVQNQVRLRRRFPVVAMDAARPALRRTFDRVVADLPCSGTGTLRKNPELKWRLRPEDVDRLAGAGLGLVEGAAHLVRTGGLLVVITCSIETEENEDLVERFLARRPDFRPFSPERLALPNAAEPAGGRSSWRIFPAADHDGFTVSVLIRKVP